MSEPPNTASLVQFVRKTNLAVCFRMRAVRPSIFFSIAPPQPASDT